MPWQRQNDIYRIKRNVPGIGKVNRSLRTKKASRARKREDMIIDLANAARKEREQFAPMFERIREATPMRTLGREEDVANLIAYLCSEQANYVTGQVIGVTGGVDLFTF